MATGGKLLVAFLFLIQKGWWKMTRKTRAAKGKVFEVGINIEGAATVSVTAKGKRTELNIAPLFSSEEAGLQITKPLTPINPKPKRRAPKAPHGRQTDLQ